MAKVVPDITIDALLDFIGACDEMYVCSSEPATRAAAITAALVTVAMVGGDFVNADDASGRKVTIGAQAGEDIDASGDATHIALCLLSDTSLRLVTTCTLQALVSGGTVDIPAWKHNVQDPT